MVKHIIMAVGPIQADAKDVRVGKLVDLFVQLSEDRLEVE